MTQMIGRASLVAGLLALGITSTQAANIIKANNANNLNDPASWVGGATPTAADVGVWNFNVTAANSVLLGSDTNWSGISILDPAGPVTINPTFGAAGISVTTGTSTITYSTAPATPLANGNLAFFNSTINTVYSPANQSAVYYVVNATPTTFQLAATPGGTAIGPNTNTTSSINVSAPFLTLGSSGIDMSKATNGLTLACPVTVGASQTWNVTNGQTLTMSSLMAGSASSVLTLAGSGTNNFTAAVISTFAGNVSLNGGVLELNAVSGNTTLNSDLGTGIITNNAGTLKNTSGNGIGNMIVCNGNCVLDCNNTTRSWEGAWAGGGTVYLTNMIASGNTYTFGGNGNGTTGVTAGSMNSFTGTLLVADNNNGVGSAGSLRFNNGGGNPNVGNAAMTLNLGGPNSAVHFTEKNSGTTTHFGALIGGPNTQLASVETYVIGEANINTTFAGTISGSTASLTKSGTATLILTGNNANTGAIIVNSGTLQIGDGVTTGQGALGAHAISVVSPGILYYNRPDAITLADNISGSGAWIVNAPLGLTYSAANTSSGTTTITAGSLLLGSAGTISAPIFVAAGAIFDVTANSAFTLASPLSGSGSINGLLTAVTGGGINPGNLAAAAGTMTFSTGLTESGSVNNTFYLSTTSGTNDLVTVTGNLTLNGTNIINVASFSGGAIANGVYPLINYSGTLNGGVTNFTANGVGVNCTLTNPPGQIAIIISPATRGATNLTWVGDGLLNSWDTVSTNWVNGVTKFVFQAGDSTLFNNVGATNNAVNLSVPVTPATVVVNSSSNYMFYGVSGISGSASLVKTNSGTLTISATNSYTGPTIVGGGVLEVLNIANGNLPSATGAATGNATNLMFYNGTVFQYSSADQPSMDRNMTLNSGQVTINITNSSANLTENGSLVGSAALTKYGPGTLTLASPDTYSGGTVISNGVLALGSNLANNNGSAGSGVGATTNPVTFDGGTLKLYGAGLSTANNYNTFYNPLVVPAGQAGTLVLFPRGAINTGNGAGLNSSLTGAGALTLEVNYVRDALSGDWSAFSGLILATNLNASGDEMRINNNFGYSNAIIYLNGTFTMDSTLTANATINIGELGGVSTAIIGSGNSSAATPTWCVGWKNTTNTFAGTIANDSSITKVGSGIWYLSGQNTYTGSTTVSNGVLAVITGPNGDGSINSSANMSVNAGAFLDYTGVSDGTLHLQGNQTFSGNGVLRGVLDTTPGGTLAPGGINGVAIKTLTVTSNANLGGTSWMKLSRGTTPNSDRLVVSNAISYAGTLVVTNVGAPLQVGDTFKIFSTPTAAYNNAFGAIILPDYYTFDTSQLTVNGTITVTAVASKPAITKVDFSSLSTGTIILNATNGLPNGAINILTSTDLTLPLSSWTVNASTTFDGSGNLTGFGITVDPTQKQLFIRIQAQ